MLGMNQGTNSKKLKYHFYQTDRKVENKHWKTNITKIFVEVNKDCHLNATWVATQTENAFAMGSKLIVVIKRHF